MNNTKTLILKERVRAAWFVLWLLLFIANIFVYIDDPAHLSIDAGADFENWIVKFLSPHNWLALATALLALNGFRSIWLVCEQRWPVIKDFRFIPVVASIGAMLIFVGANF